MPETGKSRVWKVVRITLGWALLLLGVIGLFLPLLQGILLIVSGLTLLSTHNRWARQILDRFRGWRASRRTNRSGAAEEPD